MIKIQFNNELNVFYSSENNRWFVECSASQVGTFPGGFWALAQKFYAALEAAR